MLEEHCVQESISLFICDVQDTIKGRPLWLEEKWAYATQPGKHGDKKNNGSKLPDVIEIALGAKVMVTTNMDTDKNIANGSHGKIMEIMLDANEPVVSNDAS